MMRVAAVQSCPELANPVKRTFSTSASTSTSSKTTTGALPPSSRWSRLMVSAADLATTLPVLVSPVMETMSTLGWLTIPEPRAPRRR
jgi:hypothetical protein